MANGNGNGTVWKTIALVAVTALIGLGGSMVYVIHTWSFSDDIDKLEGQVEALRSHQEDIESQLAVLQVQVQINTRQMERLYERADGLGSSPP